MFKNSVTLAHRLFQYLETFISNIKKIKSPSSKKRHFGIVFSGDPTISSFLLLSCYLTPYVSGLHRSGEHVFPCTQGTVLPARLT